MRTAMIVVAVVTTMFSALAAVLEVMAGAPRSVWVREGLLSLACLALTYLVVTGG
jgi:hypothetical protein